MYSFRRWHEWSFSKPHLIILPEYFDLIPKLVDIGVNGYLTAMSYQLHLVRWDTHLTNLWAQKLRQGSSARFFRWISSPALVGRSLLYCYAKTVFKVVDHIFDNVHLCSIIRWQKIREQDECQRKLWGIKINVLKRRGKETNMIRCRLQLSCVPGVSKCMKLREVPSKKARCVCLTMPQSVDGALPASEGSLTGRQTTYPLEKLFH